MNPQIVASDISTDCSELDKQVHHLVESIMALTEDSRHRVVAHILQVGDPANLKRIVARLIGILRSRNVSRCQRACAILVNIGQPAIAMLICRLGKSRSVPARILIAEALGQIGKTLKSGERVQFYFELDVAWHLAQEQKVQEAIARAIALLNAADSRQPALDPSFVAAADRLDP